MKRTGDKENSTINSVNRGTVLCPHVTAIRYHVIAIYRYLLFFASTVTTTRNLRSVTAKPTDLTSSYGETRKTVDTKDQYATQRVRGAYTTTVC